MKRGSKPCHVDKAGHRAPAVGYGAHHELRVKVSTTVRALSEPTRRTPVDSSVDPPTLWWNHVESWNHFLLEFNIMTTLDL